MTKHIPSEFETKLKQSLDQADLDVVTQQQLRDRRKQAIKQTQRPALLNWFGDMVLWLKKPAGNMVLASVLAIAIFLPQQNQPSSYDEQDLNQTALLELIDTPDDETLDETTDPDFYLWLAEVEGQNA